MTILPFIWFCIIYFTIACSWFLIDKAFEAHTPDYIGVGLLILYISVAIVTYNLFDDSAPIWSILLFLFFLHGALKGDTEYIARRAYIFISAASLLYFIYLTKEPILAWFQ